MWPPQVETEQYTIVYLDSITIFKVLYSAQRLEWGSLVLLRCNLDIAVHEMVILTDIDGMHVWRHHYSTGTILLLMHVASLE